MIADVIKSALEIISELSLKYQVALKKHIEFLSEEIARLNNMLDLMMNNSRVLEKRIASRDAEIENLKAEIYQLRRKL